VDRICPSQKPLQTLFVFPFIDALNFPHGQRHPVKETYLKEFTLLCYFPKTVCLRLAWVFLLMALAEFLKQIDLEELYSSLGAGGKKETGRGGDTQLEEPGEKTASGDDAHTMDSETASASIVPGSVPTTTPEPLAVSDAPSSSAKPFSPQTETNKRSREVDVDKSESSTKRPNREASMSQTRRQLHSVIEELWDLVPEDQKDGGNQPGPPSRSEKVEMAVEYLRNLQDRFKSSK
jgi:hypothetical protein